MPAVYTAVRFLCVFFKRNENIVGASYNKRLILWKIRYVFYLHYLMWISHIFLKINLWSCTDNVNPKSSLERWQFSVWGNWPHRDNKASASNITLKGFLCEENECRWLKGFSLHLALCLLTSQHFWKVSNFNIFGQKKWSNPGHSGDTKTSL